MMNKIITNQKDTEKVLLVVIDFKKTDSHWSAKEILKEMEELIDSFVDWAHSNLSVVFSIGLIVISPAIRRKASSCLNVPKL